MAAKEDKNQLSGIKVKVVSVQSGSTVQNVTTLTNTIIKKGYSPFIFEETGTWYEYDENLKAFVDTNVPASTEGLKESIEANTANITVNSGKIQVLENFTVTLIPMTNSEIDDILEK